MIMRGSSVAIGANEATRDEARTLDIRAGTSLLTVEEIDCDGSEQPVRYSHHKFRSDRIWVVADTLNEYKICLAFRFQRGTVVAALL